MEYLTLDELIEQLQAMRATLGKGDMEVLYSVNMAEYEGGFERVVYSRTRQEVFLDDGTMKYVPEYGVS